MLNTLRKHPLFGFLAFNYMITWALAFPLVATAQGWFGISVSFRLHYLTAYGPLLAAVIMIGVTKGKDGILRLLRQVVDWHVKLIWFLTAAFSLIVLFVIAAFISYIVSGDVPNVRLLGNLNYLPYLGVVGAWIFWIFNSGLGEEVGWRGYLLPLLQQKNSPVVASLIAGLFWIIWHFPFFFYLGTYEALGITVLPLFAVGIVSGSVILTWLFNNTGGSVLMAILWHGALNLVTASPAEELAVTSAIISTSIIVWATLLLILRPTGLRREDAITQPLSP